MNGPPGAKESPPSGATEGGQGGVTAGNPGNGKLSLSALRGNAEIAVMEQGPGGQARGRAGDEGRGADTPRPAGPLPLVSFPYGQMTSVVSVYPYGLHMDVERMNPSIKPGRFRAGGGVPKRGTIETFSEKAAGRLRAFVVKYEVPGHECHAYTLTTHGKMAPEEWRGSWSRFRHRAIDLKVPIVFRVELQKRKAPHIHCTAWLLPRGDLVGLDGKMTLPWRQQQLFETGWLECVREQDDPDSRRYAVKHGGQVANEGWAVYQALHSGKSKREQLGWKGKQWGIINWGMFKARVCDQVELTNPQRFRLQRILRRLLRWPGGEPRPLPADRNWLRVVSSKSILPVVRWVKGNI